MANVSQIQMPNGNNYNFKDYNLFDIISEQYNSSKSYVVGDYCIYQNQIYKCIENTTGSFNSVKWTAVVITDELGG